MTAIEIVSAGAGSGKTHRVTEIIKDAIEGGLEPESILATTFTRKAAAELVERARLKLLEGGHAEEAVRLADSLIGTVNSVCGRILEDCAFDAGLSPALTVVSETEEPAVFSTAIAPIIAEYADEIEPIADRLGCSDRAVRRSGGFGSGHAKEWREHVRDIVRHARNNLLDDAALADSARRSAETMLAMLPPPVPQSPEELDAGLAEAIRAALWQIGDGDGTQKTERALETLRSAANALATSSTLPYATWASLAKLDPGKASRPHCEPVITRALLHDRHPRLREDLKTFIELCFACARRALGAYAEFKRRNGLIDFCDQETLAYQLLGDQRVRRVFRERLRLMVVDEFQDTSPIQLALFMRLAECIERVVWVGDPKQAIYGFRGTDPDLMTAAVESVEAAGRTGEVLRTSRRSRPGLVALANWAFTPAFGTMGLSEDLVRLDPVRADSPEHRAPLHLWEIVERNVDNRAAAVATGVVELLNEPERMVIADPRTDQMRPIVPGDVAILCRGNAFLDKVARALAARGVRVAVEWDGLLQTDEARVALAALRYLVRKDDTLAVAELLHLTGGGTDGQDWLYEWLEQKANPPWREDPRIRRLDEGRDRLIELTPSEVLDLALTAASVVHSVSRWPNADQRFANLDALRVLARKYEDGCRAARLAGTAQGLVVFLYEVASGRADLNKQPRAIGEDAVTVLTYHKAKGLEWPVVVLTELANEQRPRMFEAAIESDAERFDPHDPLKDRHIRFWPWPYGSNRSQVGLDASVMDTEAYRRLAERGRREEIRLLYVGMTRARDYLVLAADPSKTAWLDLLAVTDGEARQIIRPGSTSLSLGNTDIEVESRVCRADSPAKYAHLHRRYGARIPEGGAPIFRPRRIAASSLKLETTADPKQYELISIGPRLPTKRTDAMDRLGSAIHRFLAADDPAVMREERLDIAADLLRVWEVEGHMNPEDLLLASERLNAFLESRYRSFTVLREWPVHRRDASGQEMYGQIDGLVVLSDNCVIVDHKSFPGPERKWGEKAVSYRGQLDAYRIAVEAATGLPVREMMVHMPIVGQIVRLVPHGPLVPEPVQASG